MGRYFKIIDKNRKDGRIDIVDAPIGSQVLYEKIDEIVGDKVNPVNGILFSIEVDGWGELDCIDEVYETRDFVVDCISEEDYEEYQN